METAAIPSALLDDLSAAASLVDVLQAFSPWLRQSVGADAASVTLISDRGAYLDIWVRDGAKAIRVDGTVPIEGSLTGQAVTEQRTVVTNDLVESSGLEAPKLLQGGFRSTLNIPLRHGGRTLGAANFAHADPSHFSEEDGHRALDLCRLLATYVAVHEHVVRQKHLEDTDELTGVLGRRAIVSQLRDHIARSAGKGAATLYVDLDGFKLINDSYGHAAGDKVLAEVAKRFANCLRPGDTIGRLGGDEFLVVLDPGTDQSALLAVADRLLGTCDEPVDLGLSHISVAASIGAAMATDQDTTTADEMLVEADLAMYHAKRTRVPVVVADESITHQAEIITTIDREVEYALESGELVHHYQPIRSLVSMEILGVEALLRWFHPVHGLIPPPVIIERIETLGLVPQLTQWTLQTAGSDLARLRDAAPAFSDKAVSINLTAPQLGWSGFLEAHAAMNDNYSLRPVDIIIEVVESGSIDVGTAAEETLRTLSNQDSIIALDDFGTGHNVLGYFAQFPVDTIKFDRSLIEAVPSSERVRAVIRGLSQVAQELGINALAEGIERQEQVELSLELGILKGQGYHLGKPMALAALVKLVNEEFHPVARR